jgi:hypothetical protein
LLVVAGKHDGADTHGMQLADGLPAGLAHRVSHTDHGQDRRRTGDSDRGLAFGFKLLQRRLGCLVTYP